MCWGWGVGGDVCAYERVCESLCASTQWWQLPPLRINTCTFYHLHEQSGWTPLHSAALIGHVDTARLLLEHGADVNTRDMVSCPLYGSPPHHPLASLSTLDPPSSPSNVLMEA